MTHVLIRLMIVAVTATVVACGSSSGGQPQLTAPAHYGPTVTSPSPSPTR